MPLAPVMNAVLPMVSERNLAVSGSTEVSSLESVDFYEGQSGEECLFPSGPVRSP